MVRIVERRGGVCIIRVLYYTPAEIATTRCCSCQLLHPQGPHVGAEDHRLNQWVKPTALPSIFISSSAGPV